MEKHEIEKLRSLPCEGVAQRLGLTIKHHKALCPFHDDHTPSLTFKGHKFRCWSCGESGDSISLAEKMLGKGFVEACRWLADEHNVILTEYKPKEPNPSPKGGGWEGAKYSRYFEHPFLSPAARQFLFDERKLDPRVVRWCRLNSFRDRQGTNWLQIPYYDRAGKLVGVQNRNLSSPPKGGVRGGLRFRFPRGSRCSIYNLPVLSLLKPGDDLYIAEGCSDCWALLSAGHKAIAIPSATLLTKPVLDQLLQALPPSPTGEGTGVRLHMYPDRDAPGERLFLQLQEILPGLEHHQLPPGCKDYAEYYSLTPNPSPRRGEPAARTTKL